MFGELEPVFAAADDLYFPEDCDTYHVWIFKPRRNTGNLMRDIFLHARELMFHVQLSHQCKEVKPG